MALPSTRMGSLKATDYNLVNVAFHLVPCSNQKDVWKRHSTKDITCLHFICETDVSYLGEDWHLAVDYPTKIL